MKRALIPTTTTCGDCGGPLEIPVPQTADFHNACARCVRHAYEREEWRPRTRAEAAMRQVEVRRRGPWATRCLRCDVAGADPCCLDRLCQGPDSPVEDGDAGACRHCGRALRFHAFGQPDGAWYLAAEWDVRAEKPTSTARAQSHALMLTRKP